MKGKTQAINDQETKNRKGGDANAVKLLDVENGVDLRVAFVDSAASNDNISLTNKTDIEKFRNLVSRIVSMGF